MMFDHPSTGKTFGRAPSAITFYGFRTSVHDFSITIVCWFLFSYLTTTIKKNCERDLFKNNNSMSYFFVPDFQEIILCGTQQLKMSFEMFQSKIDVKWVFSLALSFFTPIYIDSQLSFRFQLQLVLSIHERRERQERQEIMSVNYISDIYATETRRSRRLDYLLQ